MKVYKAYHQFSKLINPFELGSILRKVLQGNYVLSPLTVKIVDYNETLTYLDRLKSPRPDVLVGIVQMNQGGYSLFIPKKEDGIVLMALSAL